MCLLPRPAGGIFDWHPVYAEATPDKLARNLCAEHQIPFTLGHALYMKAIHGGKTKNDKIDSYKIALLLKGGNFPTAYPYPAKWRAPPFIAPRSKRVKPL